MNLSIHSNESLLLTVGVSGGLLITEYPSAFPSCIHSSLGSFLYRDSPPKLSCHILVGSVRDATAKMQQLLNHKSERFHESKNASLSLSKYLCHSCFIHLKWLFS